MKMCTSIRISAFVLFVFATTGRAHAEPILTLDCTNGCDNVSFGGAIWSTEMIHPSGTGVFEPFVRIQANGQLKIEDGHNTDARSQNFLNDEKGGIWTHAVLVSDLAVFQIDGASYFRFALDLGEPMGHDNSLLSLDALTICMASSGSLVMANGCPTQPYAFNLDGGANREVLLDHALIGMGNGASDLFVYIPAVTTGPYLYLYSSFGARGGGYAADGTFEEWAFSSNQQPTAVPEPTSLMMLGAGLVGVGGLLRRRVRHRR